MGEFLVSVELKHDSLYELHHSNNGLVVLDGFTFANTYQLGEKTLSALSVENFERPFRVLFQNLLSVNEFFILASRIPVWTIVIVVSLTSNDVSVGADSVWIQNIIDGVLHVASVLMELDPTDLIESFE